MTALKVRPALAAGLVCFILGSPPGAGPQEAVEYEKRLSKIKVDIASLKVKLAEEEKKEKTMLSALDRIGFRKKLIRNELAALGIELEKNQSEMKSIQGHIPDIQSRLEREKESLGKVLVALYKRGRLNALRFFLEAPDLKSLLIERKNLSVLAGAEERVISEYVQGLNELGLAELSRKSKELDIQDLIRKADLKKAELEAEEQRNLALLGQIRTSEKTTIQTLEELNLRAQELQKLLERFGKQEMSLPFPLVPLYEKRGKLPWPAGGNVKQRFGLQRHPQFNTVTMNNGIEIAPAPNDLTVRAVHAGKVVFADYFQGYGNLLIIDHGMSYYSLYGHCAEFLAGSGDFVKAGQPLALAGDTGSMIGLSLYFEIRYKTKALDPLQWLARR